MSERRQRLPRWRLVFGSVFLLAAVCGITYRLTEPKEFRPSAEMPWLWPLLWIALIVFALVTIIGAGIRRGIRGYAAPLVSTTLQPGNYRIRGVDRQTRNDVSRNFNANSEANARAKAELDGIVVTSIERI